MQAQSLHDLLFKGEDGLMKMRQGKLPLEDIVVEGMRDDMKLIYRLFFALHLSVAATAVFIVLKFFKGFEANPRLQTVTMTLKCVFIDVCHFVVIILPLYASFAIIGHVLFGADILNFYTLGASFNTGITVLMGEFSWYTDLSETPASLPSGMPRALLAVWFVAYMTLILLVMLNMLLAIVLERYSEVATVLQSRTDARTLWHQSKRFLQRKVEMRKFIPLYKIRHRLENDADPAHKAEIVTRESLQQAFGGMSEVQADWMIKFLREELAEHLLAAKRSGDESRTRSMRTERLIQSIAEELHVIGTAVEGCMLRIDSLESAIEADPNLLLPLPWSLQESETLAMPLASASQSEAATQTPRPETPWNAVADEGNRAPGKLLRMSADGGDQTQDGNCLNDVEVAYRRAKLPTGAYFECCM